VLLKYIKNIKDKTMPGMKKMPQDKKEYKSKEAMRDGQDTLNTFQPRKGGIYMDREDGKLPMDRVGKYYQETNPKMEQEKKKKESGPIPTIPINKLGHTGRGIAGSANEVIRAVNPYVSKAGSMVKSGLKSVGKFITDFDDRAQPTSNISRR